MLLTVPVYPANIALLANFVAVMRQKGGLRHHPMLFVASPSVLPQVQKEAAILRAVCPEVDIVKSEREPTGGSIWQANMMFQDVQAAIRLRKDRPQWMFYCDPTCTPLTADCWDQILAGHMKAGRMYSGVVCTMPEQKAVAFPVPEVNGKYLMKCGVYPGDLERFDPSAYGMMRVVNKGFNAHNEAAPPPPMSIQLGGAVAGRSGAHHMDLIFYDERGPVNVTNMDNIRPGSVLHVGCQDGSLAKLLLEGQEFGGAPETERKNADYYGTVPPNSWPQGLGEAIKGIPKVMEERLSKIENQIAEIYRFVISLARTELAVTEPATAPDEAMVEQESAPIPFELPASIPGKDTLEKIHALVTERGQISVADIFEQLKTPSPATIKSYIRQPGSGLENLEGMIRRVA
jgi:hypothetical protein